MKSNQINSAHVLTVGVGSIIQDWLLRDGPKQANVRE